MSKSYNEITAKLREHFEPSVNVIAEWFHFHKCDQKAGESIMEYVVALCRLASCCKFEAYLDQAIRNRFVCGLRSESIKKNLLAEKGLALSIAKRLRK